MTTPSENAPAAPSPLIPHSSVAQGVGNTTPSVPPSRANAAPTSNVGTFGVRAPHQSHRGSALIYMPCQVKSGLAQMLKVRAADFAVASAGR